MITTDNIFISRFMKGIRKDDHHFWYQYDEMHEWLLSRQHKTSFYRQLIFYTLIQLGQTWYKEDYLSIKMRMIQESNRCWIIFLRLICC